MKPVQFLLRGYAEHKDGVWQAFCIAPPAADTWP